MSLNAVAASVITAPSATFDAARQRKADKVRDALTALQSLQTRTASAQEEKKAAARQKVEQLKARIQSLRMTMVGDPKSLAKMAAQLARELSAAVKAYAAAGGSTAGMSAPSAPATAAPTAEAAPADAGPPMRDPGGAAPDTGDGTGETEASGDTNAKTDPYREVLERQQAEAAEPSRKNADREADGKFAADVKALVNDLKAILRRADEEARRRGDQTESPDQKAATEALNDIQDALSEMAPPMTGVAVSVQV